MTKNNKKGDNDNMPDKESSSKKQVGALNWRGWVIRGVVLSVLMFGFVAWRLEPMVGSMAYVYGAIFAVAILGWLGVSYYLLNR